MLEVEREALKSSPLHRISARAKLLSTLLLIAAAVATGRGESIKLEDRILSLALLEAYILILVLLAKLEMRLFLLRVGMVLPFGGGIALLRPFFEPGDALFSFCAIEVTREGLAAAVTLLGVVVVCVSAAVLLSATTPTHALIASLRSFRVPANFVLLLGMTTRFLFLYLRSLDEVVQAQRNRCFALRGRRVKRSHVLRVLGYTAAMIFIRAYRHGEAVYQAMQSRGYCAEALAARAEKLRPRDHLLLFATATAVLLSLLQRFT